MIEDRYLTVQQLADRYGFKAKTIYMWNTRGTGPPYVKVGRPRYRLSDVIAWENARHSTCDA